MGFEHGAAAGDIQAVICRELGAQARRLVMGDVEERVERALLAMAKAMEVQAAAQETMAEVAGLLAQQLGALRASLRAQGEETKVRVGEQLARAETRREQAMAAAAEVRRGVERGGNAPSS